MAFIFDKETPDVFRERINEVRSIFPQIKIFCVEGFDDIDATVNHVDNHTEIVITTRIDIDDALKKDILDVILTETQKTQSDLCINLKISFSFNSDSVETFSSSHNPFSSLVEHKKLKPYVTIFSKKH
ncbi:MAG: glycosyltransferase [Pseudomonadota bacterium]|nr:glycosyltransferase [Pseudomonadota bacterium]